MTITRTTHPDYDETFLYMSRADDVYNDRIKDKGKKYLPIAGSMPNDGSNDTEKFNQYKEYKYTTTTLPMAVFYNFTNLTLNAAIGAIMRKPPVMQFTDGDKKTVLDYMIDNADGKGNGLTQVARKSLSSQYLNGKSGYLVSVPEMGNLNDTMNGRKVPRIIPYDAKNILDWDTDYVDGQEVLTMLLLSEKMRSRVDGSLSYCERLIKFEVVDGNVEYEISEDSVTVESDFLMKNGAIATAIPFHLAGAINNDWSLDPAPLRTLIDLNLLHYIMFSRDMQGRWDLAELQLMVNIGTSSTPAEDLKALNPMGIVSDSSVAIVVANGGDAKYLQANESDLLAAAPERVLEMSVKAGAQLFAESGSNETATAATIRSSNSTATMSSIASNNGDALYNAIIDAAGYFGTVGGLVLDNINFALNREFMESKLGAQELTAYTAAVIQGVLPRRAMFDVLKSSGELSEDTTFEDYENMLREDAQGAMPNVSGEV